MTCEPSDMSITRSVPIRRRPSSRAALPFAAGTVAFACLVALRLGVAGDLRHRGGQQRPSLIVERSDDLIALADRQREDLVSTS
jgi:hypothetical protein